MKIVPITETYLNESASIFAKEYTEDSHVTWDFETSKKYLQGVLEAAPNYCVACVDDNDNFLGSIFSDTCPYYKGECLFIDSIQVSESARNQGVAKLLFKYTAEQAKLDNLNGIHLLADDRKTFPKEWYQKMGFKKTGWVEFESNIDSIINTLS